ncbi:MAG: hypothetical protein AAGE52_06365 [Myxococcota bacterium]
MRLPSLPSPAEQKASKLRWYFGVVAVIGSLALAMEVSTPGQPLLPLSLAIVGLAVMASYFVCCFGFQRLRSTPWISRVPGFAALWGIGKGVQMYVADSPLVIPFGLFVILPCIGAWLLAGEVRADSAA